MLIIKLSVHQIIRIVQCLLIVYDVDFLLGVDLKWRDVLVYILWQCLPLPLLGILYMVELVYTKRL